MMKLSEAIRLGAMLLPQCRDLYFDGPLEAPTACCAKGGAALALGFIRTWNVVEYLRTQWPFLLEFAPSPVSVYSMRIEVLIDVLNSTGWTRERIADWVATIEPQDVPSVEEVEHEPVSAPA